MWLTLACVRTHELNTPTYTPSREGKLTNGSAAAQLDGKCVFKQRRVTLTHATLSGRSVIKD